jgi:hypothetical protein
LRIACDLREGGIQQFRGFNDLDLFSILIYQEIAFRSA